MSRLCASLRVHGRYYESCYICASWWSLSVHLEEGVENGADEAVLALLEQHGAQMEAHQRLVLLKQPHGRHLVHLPPLQWDIISRACEYMIHFVPPLERESFQEHVII